MFFTMQEGTKRFVLSLDIIVWQCFLDVDVSRENKVFWAGMEGSPGAMESYSTFAPGLWQGTQKYQNEIISVIKISNTCGDTAKKILQLWAEKYSYW